MSMLGLQMFLDMRKQAKKHDLQVTTPVLYPTGFLPLDYANGMRVKCYNENNDLVDEYDSVGLVDGTLVMFTADPGLGKTTLCEQIAVQISSQYENSFVIHEDIEQSSHINRIYSITGMNTKWIKTHYSIMQDSHTESIEDRFLDHAKMKLNNRKVYEQDTGLKDLYGQSIKRFIPTIVIIDSLSIMRSEDGSILLEDSGSKTGIDDTTNNMAGARQAKFNSEMFKQILPYAKKANILIFVINQINKKIQTGYLPAPADLIGMGADESLAGGRVVKYLMNNVVRLKNKGQLKPDQDYGINGNVISAVFLKSRTNASNVPFDLIFDKQLGFSKVLTLLHFAFTNNIVKKSGAKYYIPGCENYLFTKKTFAEVAAKNPQIIVSLYDQCVPILQEWLSSPDDMKSDEDEKSSSEFSDDMDELSEDF